MSNLHEIFYFPDYLKDYLKVDFWQMSNSEKAWFWHVASQINFKSFCLLFYIL